MIQRIQASPALQVLQQGLPSSVQDKLPAFQLDRVSLSRPGLAERLDLIGQIMVERLAEAFPSLETPSESAEVAPQTSLYPSGATPKQVAGTIFRGVSKLIFGAFSRAHPDLSKRDLETFIADVSRGLEQGVGEARSTLESMESLDDEVDTAIDETVDLLQERLNSWFDELRAAQAE